MAIETGALTFTDDFFKYTIDKVVDTFMEKHNLKTSPKAFQLFGYGSYDEKKPSLKTDFEKFSLELINGKYLYDKFRDYEKGKTTIKVNEHYKGIILLYLGYQSVFTLMEESTLTAQEKQKQLILIKGEDDESEFYFINYYFGEDDTIIKGKTVISNNWKNIQHTFLYPMSDGSLKEYYSQGVVIRQGDTIYMRTKTLSGGRYIDGANEIYYIGHKSPASIRYFVGTFCTFDVYTNTVAGRSILERCDTKEEMDIEAELPTIPSYIALEVRNKRIVNTNQTVGQNFLEISTNSPYAAIYGKLPGHYKFSFGLEGGFMKEALEFDILSTNYAIVNRTPNVYIEKDRIELINKGSVVSFRFNFSGMIALDRVNIYIKTYYLKGDKPSYSGVFSGIDNENRLVNGELTLSYLPFEK